MDYERAAKKSKVEHILIHIKTQLLVPLDRCWLALRLVHRKASIIFLSCCYQVLLPDQLYRMTQSSTQCKSFPRTRVLLCQSIKIWSKRKKKSVSAVGVARKPEKSFYWCLVTTFYPHNHKPVLAIQSRSRLLKGKRLKR